MIRNVISFSLNNKLIIGLLTLALIIGGIWSMHEVPLDAVPDITNNQVQVITQAPNLGTEDIEQFVTYPIEVAMANLPGVLEIRSISRFGLSLVTIVFEDDMGTYLPRQLVAEQLTQVREEIPRGFGEPFMGPISTGLGEIYQYTLEVDPAFQDAYTSTDLRTMQDWIIRRQMAMVPGVVEVNGFGGNIKQYEVAVDPDELRSMGLTITDIFNALESNNQNTGGAYIEKDHNANFIRGEGLVRSKEDLENIVVKNIRGLPITIKDVARVQLGSAVRYGAFTKDGKGEAVGGMIMMLKGANSNKVIEAVKSRMQEIEKTLPEGITISAYLDRSALIGRTTFTVKKNLIEGALIVTFVLVLLLGSLRGGLITASIIPLSLLFAFILMRYFNVWANLMSLGAIDFGIIVDGAVIIVEGTIYQLGLRLGGQRRGMGQSEMNSITGEAAGSVMNSAFFGQLIILIVFAPILFLEGIEGKMFRPMAYTFGFAVLGAIILCLTYVPVMSSLLLRPGNPSHWLMRVEAALDRFSNKVLSGIHRIYLPVLNWALKWRKLVLFLAMLLFGASVYIFTSRGAEFIPQLDEGDIAFHIILKPGSSLSESIAASTQIESILMREFPEVKRAMTRFGVADVPTDPMPMDIGDCFAILKPKDEWVTAQTKDELIEKIKARLNEVPGLGYEFTQPIEMRFNELITGIREDIAVKLYGEDLDILAAKAEEMAGIISSIDGVGDVRAEATVGLPQITVHYNRHKLAQYGLQVDHLNAVVQSAFAGSKAGVIFEGERRFDLVVRLDEAHRRSIEDLQNLYINLPNGTQIPLKEVAEISYQSGPMQIGRDNTQRRVSVGINVRGRDIKSLVDEIQQRLDAGLDLPPGYFLRYGGAFENLERATSRLQAMVPVALALIFLLLFFALNSVSQAAMIYMAVPLAAIGGVVSLWLREMPFSISAGVGFIVLFGVAVLNGLVLVSRFNSLREEGLNDLVERIVQGARERVRPVLLTATAAIMGFLPMAISTSAGAEVQRPLATVVIGGLISATMLTLVVVPVLYYMFENRRRRPRRGTLLVLIFILGSCGLMPASVQAQSSPPTTRISIDSAVSKALASYPAMRAFRLETASQRALQKTVADPGTTHVFTGGEELGGDAPGIFTIIGLQQQGIDLFGTKSRQQLRDGKIALAEARESTSAAELTYQVRMRYGDLYVAQRQKELHEQLDSSFVSFAGNVRLRYETEDISRLEYLSTANLARQVAMRREQAQRDYSIALQQFNRWLPGDTMFTATVEAEPPWVIPLEFTIDTITDHPQLAMARGEMEVARRAQEAVRTRYLPRFHLMAGLQRVGDSGGYLQYQVGASMPLFGQQKQGYTESAEIDYRISEQHMIQTRLELQSRLQETLEKYYKWLSSWQYYQDERVSLAREERQGAATAYAEGAIDYTTYMQHVEASVQVEIDALTTLKEYLHSRFLLEYLLQNQ